MLKLGFDIGITSIGWALIDTEKSDDFGIVDCGVRIFTRAENPKTGASLALPRRLARSSRRRLHRRKARLNIIKSMLCKEFGFKKEIFEKNDKNLPPIYATSKSVLTPWKLRLEALKRKLEKQELARVILHIAKHRGYGDLRYGVDDVEGAKVLGAIEKNLKIISDDIKTGAQILAFKRENLKRELPQGINPSFRNVGDTYDNSIPQSINKFELELILQKQSEFGYKFSENFCDKLVYEVFFSKPLKDFEDKVGKCKFKEFLNENRAAKFSPLAQEFIASGKILNKLIEIAKLQQNSKDDYSAQICDKDGEIKDFKTLINQISQKAKSVNKFSFKALQNALNLPEDFHIPGAKKDTFIDFEKYKKFSEICRKKFGDDFCKVENDAFNDIARICTYKKDFDSLKDSLLKSGYKFDESAIKELLNLKFAKNIELSASAIKAILPYIKSGFRYDEAIGEKCANLHLNLGIEKGRSLPPFNDTPFAGELTNPVVARAIKEYRKVLNAIVKKYGLVHEIRFELTRDVGKNRDMRNKIQKAQDENFKANENAKAQCIDMGLEVNNANILKIKLYKEQNEFCVYSGAKISPEDLKNPNLLEIDHILPYSRSFDDSQSNKVLVFRSKNQEKGNLTPYEKWGESEKWETISKIAEIIKKKNESKFKKLTMQNFNNREQGFRTSAFNDTGYLNRLIMNYTKDYLQFLQKDSPNARHVFSINGKFTTNLRRFFGLDNKDRTHHLHHAEDAILVALCDSKMEKAFSDFMTKIEQYKLYKDTNKNGEFDKEKYAQNMLKAVNTDKKTRKKLRLEDEIELKNFREIVAKKVSKIFVSQPARKKVGGALHEETLRSDKEMIAEYKSEAGFKMALQTRRIRKIGEGYVNNSNMPRVDIFVHKTTGKFYGVPIYTMDFALGELPNEAVAIGKDKNGVLKKWIEMDENYEFKFSLFPNDLVRVQKENMQAPVLAYYLSFGIATASICIAKHNNKKDDLSDDEKLIYPANIKDKVEQPSLGINGLKVFEKCVVSPLGEVSDFKFEERQDIKAKSPKKDK